MKNKGFTLIELLAVIVILAIIALIATPIILGIINNARKESQERSVELYATAVKNGIALSQLNTGTSVKAGKYTSSTLPFEVSYDGDVECATIEIYEDGTIYVDGCTVNQETVDYAYGKNKGTDKACTLDDKDGDGKASLSDVVTCGTESFYVMTNENNEITMLSMYNLYVGNVVTYDENWNEEISVLENSFNKQSDKAKGYFECVEEEWNECVIYGTVAFSNEIYWEGTETPNFVYNENSNLYQYVNEYQRILNEDLNVRSARATLISVDQLENLGCDSYNGTCITNTDEGGNATPSWVYSTSYWSGNAINAVVISGVIFVSSNGSFSISSNDYDSELGVRPVVTISTSEI